MGSNQTMVQGSSGSRGAVGGVEKQSSADAKQDIIRYWVEVQSLKQMGVPGVKARHIAYTRVFGKGDAK